MIIMIVANNDYVNRGKSSNFIPGFVNRFGPIKLIGEHLSDQIGSVKIFFSINLYQNCSMTNPCQA